MMLNLILVIRFFFHFLLGWQPPVLPGRDGSSPCNMVIHIQGQTSKDDITLF